MLRRFYARSDVNSHFAEMVFVLYFPVAQLVNDIHIDRGAYLRESYDVLTDVIGSHNAAALQVLQSCRYLFKTAVDLCECGVDFSFHCLYPIGEHVTQRIQPLLKNGKRRYCNSIRQAN